jgi:hypothetical protein
MACLRKLLTTVLVVCLAGLALPLPAHAVLLPTPASAQPDDRARIAALLERDEARAQLAARGIDPREVEARVAALTDEEAARIAAQIDELPAGGVLGFLLFVFLVLLITDILGFTKIFPFTRPVR